MPLAQARMYILAVPSPWALSIFMQKVPDKRLSRAPDASGKLLTSTAPSLNSCSTGLPEGLRRAGAQGSPRPDPNLFLTRSSGHPCAHQHCIETPCSSQQEDHLIQGGLGPPQGSSRIHPPAFGRNTTVTTKNLNEPFHSFKGLLLSTSTKEELCYGSEEKSDKKKKCIFSLNTEINEHPLISVPHFLFEEMPITHNQQERLGRKAR